VENKAMADEQLKILRQVREKERRDQLEQDK